MSETAAKIMPCREQRLRTAIETSRDERGVKPVLREYPLLLVTAFNPSWNFHRCLPEFRLGGDFVADYLILSADSGSWNALFVEAESPRAILFTKRGVPRSQCATGLRQLDDWERWLRQNGSLFRETLSKLLEAERVPAQCSRADVHTLAHTEMRDPRTVIRQEFILLIGRRESLSQLDQERRAQFSAKGRQIATYDRLLDVARRLDAAL